MEIVGSVGHDEVPEHTRPPRPPSPYMLVAIRAVEDHQQQRVTVIRVKDENELKSFRNNIGHPLRKLGYKPRLIVVRQVDEIRIFVELTPREPAPVQNNDVDATFSLGRRRSG